MPQRILNQQKLMLFLFVDSASYLKIQGEDEREREGERGLLLNISIIISKLFYFGTVQKCCA